MMKQKSGPTAEFLSQAIDASSIPQKRIAKHAGFDRPNVISMMKSGDMKVPIDRIPAISEACGVDARVFLRIALQEYHPEVWEVLEASFGEVLTEAEQDLLLVYRLANLNADIEIDARLEDALSGLFALASQRPTATAPVMAQSFAAPGELIEGRAGALVKVPGRQGSRSEKS